MALITESQAQDYMDKILNTDAWDTATTNERTSAIEQASIIINNLNFRAFVDLTDPPTNIIYAVAQSALDFLDGVDTELEIENLRVTSQIFGQVRTSYDSRNVPEYYVHGIPSQKAWNFLKPYLRDGHKINIRRVS